MKKTAAIFLSAIIMLSLLCGCGAASFSNAADSKVAPAEASSQNGFYYETESASASDFSYSESQESSGVLPANAKVIYSADLTLESTEFDDAAARLNALVTELGGYFESSSVDNYGSYRSADYIVRVPAESFDKLCTSAGGIGNLTSIYRRKDDVSESYYDTDSRLQTQKTKLARLQELLANAESMEDIITIESAISDTELAIDQLTGTLRRYDSLIGYSTVNISLREVYKLSDMEQAPITFGDRLSAAFRRGCTGFVDGVQDFVLAVARNWAGILLFLALCAAVIVCITRIRRSRRAKRASRKEEGK